MNPADIREYTNVARCYGLKSPYITLENNRFRGSKTNIIATDCKKMLFKSANFLSAVGSLKLRILRMTNSGVPGLKSVEIWGQPCRSTDPSIISALTTPNISNIPLVIPKTIQKETKQTITLQDNETVPEDFLDSITYNTMTFPILLPSGRSIDKTSLDKLYQTGRQPFDPFTGLPFSETRKPLPNTSLKLRIDNYLAKKATEGIVHHDVPRILGSTEQSTNCIQSRLLPTTSSSATRGLKRAIDDVEYIGVIKKPTKLSKEPKNHDESLAFSLDEAVASILGDKKPKTPDKLSESESNDICCSICKLLLNNQYQLPCKHLICKTCTGTFKFQNGTAEKCPQCRKLFKRSEIILIHVNCLPL